MSTILPDISFIRLTPDGPKDGKPLDTETKFLLQEAAELNITTEMIPGTDVLKLTSGNHVEFLRNRTPSTTHSPGSKLCANKGTTRAMLTYANLPVTKGFTLVATDTPEYRRQVFNALKTPLVVKPSNSTHGAGVKLNVMTFEEMDAWATELFNTVEKSDEFGSGMVSVEETAQGEEYRIIATAEKMLAVMNRQPASVMGDGTHTIKELIELKNQDEMRNISQDMYPHIAYDEDMEQVLKSQNLSLESKPAANQKVQLRQVSNIMAGGDAVDMTDQVHPSVREMAVKVVQALPGTALVGIDFMTPDITVDQATVHPNIIEVNSAPEFAMHDMPMIGKKRYVSREVLLLMFPELRK